MVSVTASSSVKIAGDAASGERFRASIDGQEEQIRPRAAVFFTLPCERDRVSGMDDRNVTALSSECERVS
jgi:hypothetical protein